MEVDILDYATRRVLLIKYKDRKQRLMAYLFKLLNEMECSYKIYNKETLAVIRKL